MLEGLAGLYNRMGLLGSVITGLIVVFFIAGFYVNILVRRRYLSLSEELAAFCGGEINEFRSDMLNWMTEEYKASLASGVEPINTTCIIDMGLEAYQKLCVLGESYLKKINGLLITTGLFGTFLGLTSAIGNLGSIMANTSAETLMTEAGISTFQILISSLQGMSVAFITSLFGTGFSILLSVIMTFIGSGHAKKLFITQLEEYLDIKLVAEAMEAKVKQSFDRKEEVSTLAATLSDSLTLFNKTISAYTDELQALKNFNQEFSQNLNHASKSVAFLCQVFDKSSETVYQSGVSFFTCSEELKNLVMEIKNENRKAEAMSGLLAELAQKIDESTHDRKLFLKAVSEIPDRLLNYSEAAFARIERGR